MKALFLWRIQSQLRLLKLPSRLRWVRMEINARKESDSGCGQGNWISQSIYVLKKGSQVQLDGWDDSVEFPDLGLLIGKKLGKGGRWVGKVDPKTDSQELFVKGPIFPSQGLLLRASGNQTEREKEGKGLSLDKVDQKEGGGRAARWCSEVRKVTLPRRFHAPFIVVLGRSQRYARKRSSALLFVIEWREGKKKLTLTLSQDTTTSTLSHPIEKGHLSCLSLVLKSKKGRGGFDTYPRLLKKMKKRQLTYIIGFNANLIIRPLRLVNIQSKDQCQICLRIYLWSIGTSSWMAFFFFFNLSQQEEQKRMNLTDFLTWTW